MTLRTSRRTEFIRRTRLARFDSQIGRLHAGDAAESLLIHTPLQVGKYLVSPLTHLMESGLVAASVSIRSGRGSMTHDRVMRFVPAFRNHDEAARFATTQALDWINRSATGLDPFLSTQ
jgi:hypothetical protein